MFFFYTKIYDFTSSFFQTIAKSSIPKNAQTSIYISPLHSRKIGRQSDSVLGALHPFGEYCHLANTAFLCNLAPHHLTCLTKKDRPEERSLFIILFAHFLSGQSDLKSIESKSIHNQTQFVRLGELII